MYKKISIIIILIIIASFCSSKKRIERQINYDNRLDIQKNEDGSLMIRSTACDVTIKYIFERIFCERYISIYSLYYKD